METMKAEPATGEVAVLLVPLPAHGHLNQLLHIARRLASAPTLSVHYASTATHNRQARDREPSSSLASATINFHDIPLRKFATPPPDPTAIINFPAHLQPLFDATADLADPLADLLRSLAASSRRVVVIHDASMSFIAPIATTIANAEAFSFCSISAFASLFYLWETQGKPLDMRINGVSLPLISFKGCFTDEFTSFTRLQLRMRESSSGHLLNSCHAIEGTFIDLLVREPGWQDRRNFVIGPLNPVLSIRSSPVRHACLEWLDRQPPASVVYVAFGTLSSLRDKQVAELAAGLADSCQRYIWVLRYADRGDIYAKDIGRPELSSDYEQMVEGRGMVVRGWAPQLEILAHPSTGGFLSHCGWNSCMESMSMGVPMLTWPMHSDQPRNAVLVTEVLRMGMVAREWSRREEVVSAREIRDSVVRLMDDAEGKEVRRRAMGVRDAIREAAAEGGMSKSELASFIAHITRSS